MSRGVQSEQLIKRGRILRSDQERMRCLLEERRALCGIILSARGRELYHRQQLRVVQAQIEILAKRLRWERV